MTDRHKKCYGISGVRKNRRKSAHSRTFHQFLLENHIVLSVRQHKGCNHFTDGNCTIQYSKNKLSIQVVP